jgi:hypothetical protein
MFENILHKFKRWWLEGCGPNAEQGSNTKQNVWLGRWLIITGMHVAAGDQYVLSLEAGPGPADPKRNFDDSRETPTRRWNAFLFQSRTPAGVPTKSEAVSTTFF